MTNKANFTAVPPPPLPTEPAPPLPSEPVPPPPSEPVPPPPPPQDDSVKPGKPFSFSFGAKTSTEKSKQTNSITGKTGLSFGLNKKKSGAIAFGAKSTPVRKTLSVFDESDSEEEGDTQNVNIITPQEHVATSSTLAEQQDLLEKVIDYADTLKQKEAIRPKLLIRFVRGSDAILPGTIPQKKTAKS